MTNTAQKIPAHTPGPWRVKETGPMPAHGYGHKASRGTLSVDRICYMQVIADGSNLEQMKANARLIAAAPELLEALRELLAYVDYSADAHKYDKARAALAKAE